MSFFEDFFGEGELIDILSGGQADVGNIFGRQGRSDRLDAEGAQLSAIDRAIAEERRGRGEAQGFLSPFGAIGQRGIDLSSFLGDPQAQFDFLQSNPLFQLALENANQSTLASGAAGGRLSAGDTLSQLSNNVLLSSQPLIDRQRQDIGNLLNLGSGIAQTQANVAIGQGTNVSGLLTDIGNVQAAGSIANANAQAQGGQNALTLAGALFSDPRLKDNAKIIGEENGFKLWSWDWNSLAKRLFNLNGSATGVMYPEVLAKQPSATARKHGFGMVNYEAIGVSHGY